MVYEPRADEDDPARHGRMLLRHGSAPAALSLEAFYDGSSSAAVPREVRLSLTIVVVEVPASVIITVPKRQAVRDGTAASARSIASRVLRRQELKHG